MSKKLLKNSKNSTKLNASGTSDFAVFLKYIEARVKEVISLYSAPVTNKT